MASYEQYLDAVYRSDHGLNPAPGDREAIERWDPRLAWADAQYLTDTTGRNEKMTNPAVQDVRRYGERGWRWTMTYPGSPPTERRTDAAGEGLYIWSQTDKRWLQELGPVEYRVAAADPDDAARQIIEQSRLAEMIANWFGQSGSA